MVLARCHSALVGRRRLLRLVSRPEIPCLHLVQAFDDGRALLAEAEKHGLDGIVSKRRDAPYRSGASKEWLKIKTVAWRAANRDWWQLFERSR